MPEDKPDRIQDHTCRIGVDRLLRWVLGQASSSQSKLSRGTDDVFEQPCIMCLLAVCIGKQQLVQAVAPGDIRECRGKPASNVTDPRQTSNGWLAKGVAGIYVTADLSVSR
mgnify:CR=1 FL=1